MSFDAILDELVDRIVDRIVARLDANNAPSHYSRTHLPPGVRSWRAARETAAREGIATSRPGRELIIDRRAWDTWAASRRTTRRAEPIAIVDSDARALEALGVVVPLRRAGGAR